MYEYENKNGLIPARVLEVHRQIYKAVCQYGEVTAKLKGALYKKDV